jgi:hypothetical protein
MYYLFVEVYDSSYREDIYLALQSIGVQRAITLDAQNLAGALSDERTFFTGFFRSDKFESGDVLLIQAQIGHKDLAREFLSNLREAGVNIDKEDIVSLTLVPVAAGFSRENGFTED